MYAHVELVVAEKKEALTVPKSAVIVEAGQTYCVSVTADGLIVKKAVQLGIRTDTQIEILSGLDDHEEILATNAAAFLEGQQVTRSMP